MPLSTEIQISLLATANVLLLATVFLCFVLIISVFIFRNKTQQLKVDKLNLEQLVDEKTYALKHKEQEVTDSIRYALRIQLSIIPTHHKVKSLLPKSMVYYRPKDIVSGDFYWVDTVGDEVVFAAVDCTGHGVPGAMMSVIGLKLLD